MKKKLILTLLIVSALICLFAFSISAADPEVKVGDVTYKFGEVTTLDTITIPESYDSESRVLMSDGKTYPSYYILGDTYKIGKGTFNWTMITKEDGSAYSLADIIMLEIPSNIKEMYNDIPLDDMDNAVYVSIPSITSWKNEAHFANLDSLVVADMSRATELTYMTRGFFMNDKNLTTVIWPTTSKINSIGRGAFSSCTALTSITLPEGIKTMGEDNHNNPGVFQKCANLSEVNLPSTLTFIGKKDFLDCTSLTSIEIPSSVYRICREAFQNCSSLTTVTCKDMGEATAENLYIGETTFTGTALKSATFLQDTVTVNSQAFQNLQNTTINIKKLTGSIGSNAFYNCKLVNFTDLTAVTSVGQQAFDGCTGLTRIKFGAGLTYIYAGAFQNCSSLEYVYFDKDTETLNLSKNSLFENCTALRAISFPDCVVTLSDRILKNCDSLEAVYLPESLVTLMTNGYGHGAFASSERLYFVQDWFDVVDENGNFLGDEFEMPERPDVYYFPESLTNLYDKGTGTGFHQNFAINPVLVFGTNVTKVNINDGLLCQCGKNEAKAAVFLGDMTEIKHSSQNSDGYSRLLNISYYFVNENDKSTDDVTITNNNTTTPPESAMIYFCASKTSYNIAAKNAAWGESLGEGHLYKVESNTLPTCTEAGVKGYKCFCGKASDEAEEIPALGHEKNALLDKYFASVNGTLDYYNDMVTEHSCTRCDETVYGTEDGTALFNKKGYSYSEQDTTTFSYTIYVNRDAIEEYNPALLYGIVVSANVNGAPISYADGKISHDDKTIAVEFQNTEVAYSIITAKLTNVSASTELHLSAYCVDNGSVSYLAHNTVDKIAETISHEILLEKYSDGKED